MSNIEYNIKAILSDLWPEYINRKSMEKTPLRASKSMHYLIKGYKEDPYSVISNALFDSDYNDIVLIKDIDFYSICEHHLLPFFGKAHIAYIPNGKIIGLSKINRVVNSYSRRFQTQENLTKEIIETINEAAEPKGVAIKIEAQHLCMMMRGIERQNSKTITTMMIGEFETNHIQRDKFFNLINN